MMLAMEGPTLPSPHSDVTPGAYAQPRGVVRYLPSLCVVALLIAVSTLAPGCARTPFKDDLARTPYDRYLALRGRDRPLVTIDEFGREQKALRERLSPLEGPQ